MDTSGNLDKTLLEESLEDLYEHAPSGYVFTLPDGTFAKVNQTLLTWTGYQRETLLAGMRFQDLLMVAGKIFYETHYAPLLHMQGFANEIAFDLVCHDDHHLPVLISTVQTRDRAGTPLLHRTTIFNASDRRQYERELLLARNKAEQAVQAKARLLATLSHEIRTPLHAISLATQLLERTNPTPKQQKYIRNLQSSSHSLLALVNDILDYHKLEADKAALEERSFNLRELITDLVYRVEAKAEEQQLALHVDVDERLPTYLIGDSIKIGQVLMNLLSNAIKFTEQGSVKLTVKVKDVLPDAVSLDFSVRDTGIGIAPDRLAYIFEEFAQASPDITIKYGGTGLGLAICRKLVQIHGSDIHVDSQVGEGSTFSFNLRLQRGTGK
jgi:PAS domain S-box-containing protein